MTKKHEKRTFLRAKEKTVVVNPKKFLGRKILGVIFIIIGSLLLIFSFVYFYFLPNFSYGRR
ncbi:MAG: hypothetical protein M1514_02545 [Patescibacteria group bacterium]|nr:hypothetical protein [Patescibacteria group bacterium]